MQMEIGKSIKRQVRDKVLHLDKTGQQRDRYVESNLVLNLWAGYLYFEHYTSNLCWERVRENLGRSADFISEGER